MSSFALNWAIACLKLSSRKRASLSVNPPFIAKTVAIRTFSLGLEEKSQIWDAKRTQSLALPFNTVLEISGDVVEFKNKKTRGLLASVSLFSLQTMNQATSIKVDSHHEVILRNTNQAPGAFEDEFFSHPDVPAPNDANLYLYQGSKTTLNSFEKITKNWQGNTFSFQVKKQALLLTPRFPNLILRQSKMDGSFSEVPLDKPVEISLQDIPFTEIIHENRWWKFSFISTPSIMDESEFELLDLQEAKQDRLFRYFLGMSVALATVGITLSSFLSHSPIREAAVLSTADIKIDPVTLKSEDLHTKSIQEDLPKTVLTNAPLTPPITTTIQPEFPAPAAPPSNPVTASTAPPPSIHGSAGNSPSGAPSQAGQILNRHSKMLQDAFGSVLALQNRPSNHTTVSAAGAQPGNTTNSIFSGSSSDSNSPSAVQGVGGTVTSGMIQEGAGHSKSFIQTSTHPRVTGGGYTGQNSNITVSGQGEGMVQTDGNTQNSVSGKNRSEIVAVFNKHMSEVRSCYEITLIKYPDTHGTVALAFTIDPNGKVMNPSIKETDIRNAGRTLASEQDSPLPKCLLKRLSTWTFQKPSDGKPLQVTSYPLVFKSVGGESD